MNLSALWTLEKARLTVLLEESNYGHAHASSNSNGRRNSKQINDHAALTTVLEQQHALPPRTRRSSENVLALGHGLHSSIASTRRELLFQKLVDTSATPGAAPMTRSCFDCNEFAMEFADRAPKRFDYAASDSQSAAAQSDASASVSAASPQRKDRKAPGTPASSRVASAKPTTLQLNAGTTIPKALFNSKSASVLRAHKGRKRLGPSFSSQALRPYVGDMFSTRGEYIDGMLYMSRMKRSHRLTFGGMRELGLSDNSWVDLTANALKDVVSHAYTGTGATNGSMGSNGKRRTSKVETSQALTSISYPGDTSGPETDAGAALQIQQWQRCSLTLSNWSSNPDNAQLMVQENVVDALMRLCVTDDHLTRVNCVTALMNLSHITELRREIVQQGAVKTIAEIVDGTEDATLRTACTVALCNLCCLDGEEVLLVEHGAVSALSLLINEHPKVAGICRIALFNLTCVSEPYHKIESVMKAFISLTSMSAGASSSASALAWNAEWDEITAKALCNLSNFKHVLLRLMEEGIIGAIGSLIHAHMSKIHTMLAYVLLNLSSARSCRSEMVAKGSIGTIVALTGATGEPTTKYLISRILWNLSKEPSNRLRMVFEGLLLLVNELCRGSAVPGSVNDAIRSMCARTIYNVTCSEDTRVKVVERDAVNILSMLSKKATDGDAKKMCTLALCNLLSVPQATAEIVQTGAITALIELSLDPSQTLETKLLFARALHGLCQDETTRSAIAGVGVIPAILFLTSIFEAIDSSNGDSKDLPTDGEASNSAASGDRVSSAGTHRVIQARKGSMLSDIRVRCTAALACLAADDQNASYACTPDVVHCVTQILVQERRNLAIERCCCSCLSLLCRDEQCALLMTDAGALEVVLSTCIESKDLDTKASCCYVLASMSSHPSCCMPLVRMGAISVLATLAKLKEDVGIQRCCAISLANLSAEPSIRPILVTAGTVSILSVLSNSYSEDSQRDCAKVLCNLSCIAGQEHVLVREGAVGVLMMICMVRAVRPATKETCARALLNLLTPATMKHMVVQEGLVKILPTFVALESSSADEISTLLYMKLVNDPIGRNALCAERVALRALLALMEKPSDNATLRVHHKQLLSDLVYHENSRHPAVLAGIVDTLHALAMRVSSSHEMLPFCAAKKITLVLLTLAKWEQTRMAVASAAGLVTLRLFLKRHIAITDCDKGDCVLFAISALCHLGWHDSTRASLDHPELSSALVQMLRIHSGVVGDGSLNEDGEKALVKYPDSAIKACLVTLCCLAQSNDHIETMLADRIIECLYGLLETPATTRFLESDPAFIALVCILFRQLSHGAGFKCAISRLESRAIQLFCLLAHSVTSLNDLESCLDCADVLCSLAFLPSDATDSTKKHASKLQATAINLVSLEVLSAIDALTADHQAPETRWRCIASLWALSTVVSSREKLVALGGTRILVAESRRSEESASLSMLKCCAGALCNLTIVPAKAANLNAARMVEDGAVPALIQLARMEQDEVRENCTLALSNLSSQSPKVESGAVAALLSLSLRPVDAVSATSALSLDLQVARPPLVRDERFKVVFQLPELEIALCSDMEAIRAIKLEAEFVVSTPPLPRLPRLPVSDSATGHEAMLARSDSTAEPDPRAMRRRKSSSYGETRPVMPLDLLSTIPNGIRETCDAQNLRFDKVDPAESSLLMSLDDEDDAATSMGQSDGRQDADQPDGNNTRNGSPATDDEQDSSESGETISQLRKTGSKPTHGLGITLSPLSRVVVRKTQTMLASKKMKELKARADAKRESVAAATTASTLTPTKAVTKNDSRAHLFTPVSSSSGPRNTKKHRGGITKTVSLEQLRVSAVVSGPLSPVKKASTSLVSLGTALSNNNDPLLETPDAAIAAAAAAARLYGFSVPSGPGPVASFKGSLHDSARANSREANDSAENENAEESRASLAATSNEAPVVYSATIEEIPLQAKKFGLWS